jgi:uncharacterized protein YaaQ
MMKMIVSIVKDEDTDPVIVALAEQGYTVTRIASTGGFLRQGRSTLMVGVEANKVDDAIQVINDNCAPTVEPILRRATLFVLNVEHFEEL